MLSAGQTMNKVTFFSSVHTPGTLRRSPVRLTNHLPLIVDHHCQVLEDLVYIQNVGLKHTNKRGRISCVVPGQGGGFLAEVLVWMDGY